jgi:hypothetical protein
MVKDGQPGKTMSSDHKAEDLVQQVSLDDHWNVILLYVICHIDIDPIFRPVMRLI